MLKPSLAAALVALLIAACGGSPPPTAQGPSVAGVSVQPGDLPSGMVKCDLSGDINSFLDKEKTPDPNTYNQTKTQWEAAQQKGATAAYTAFYTDSAPHCGTIKNTGADIGAANYKLLANFVVQYKDEKSAANAYSTDSIFGFSASSLKSSGAAVIDGTKTGLTQNSIVLSGSLAPQSFYIADWQNKRFVVILAILNVDAAASKTVATSENNRIK